MPRAELPPRPRAGRHLLPDSRHLPPPTDPLLPGSGRAPPAGPPAGHPGGPVSHPGGGRPPGPRPLPLVPPAGGYGLLPQGRADEGPLHPVPPGRRGTTARGLRLTAQAPRE
jgi:hypothetical protein